jgi:hypothetical protein
MRRSTSSLLGTLLLIGVGVAGCVSGGQESLRQGLLRVGIGQRAFLQEWGLPDRTASAVGEDQLRARWGGAPFAGGFFKGRRPLDVWVYERYGVEVVFEDDDLVAWRTDRTVEQLRAISPNRRQ